MSPVHAGSRGLEVAPHFTLPLDTVTQSIAVLAMTGAGKSNTAVVLAEEMYRQGLPWVAVDPKGDWWGVLSAKDGKNPGLSAVVFGGEHGHVPLEPTSGSMVADFIVDLRGFVVLDVSEMTRANQRRFLTDFATQLYRRNRDPLHVFLEEADEYIPQRFQGDMAKLVGAMETLVKRGRFRGIGVTMISQRSASLNKDVLTQAGTLIAMRVTGPTDRKAVLAWIDYHAMGKEVVQELPSLGNGEAWVCSPQFLGVIEKVRFRQRWTYDSGATPRVGVKRSDPKNMASVDLDAVRERMAETIEKAKADDPDELRKKLREREALLDQRERQIRELSAAPPVQTVTEVSVLTDDDRKMLSKLYDKMSEDALAWAEVVNQLSNLADRVRGTDQFKVADIVAPRLSPELRHVPQPIGKPVSSSATAVPSDGSLGKGERATLIVVAQYPEGVTREQLTINTGYKRSTRDAYVQRLRSAGLVEVLGPQIVATQEGIEALGGDFEPLPTGAALREHWLTRLGGGERTLLALLMDAYPNGMSRDELSERTGYKRSTRDAYLQRLRSRLLITANGDPRASDTLFERN